MLDKKIPSGLMIGAGGLVPADGKPGGAPVLFETGYGPSGLPHIGTFGEVLRTTMIRHAFQQISDIPTRLFCFSDDLDGMRKVPGNVPNQEMLRENLQKPLTAVPDPFGEFPSFGDHNNAMLRRFLDTFGFDYEFISATDFYKSGQFDDTLRLAAERYDAIMEIMLASLREERQQTYSCFLPIHPETGRVLYVPIKNVDAVRGEITFDDETGREWTLPVTGGNVKLQWKPDFGARWAASQHVAGEADQRVPPGLDPRLHRRVGADEDQRNLGAGRHVRLGAGRAHLGDEVDHEADLGLRLRIREPFEARPGGERQESALGAKVGALDRPELLGEEGHERVQQLVDLVERKRGAGARLVLVVEDRRLIVGERHRRIHDGVQVEVPFGIRLALEDFVCGGCLSHAPSMHGHDEVVKRIFRYRRDFHHRPNRVRTPGR